MDTMSPLKIPSSANGKWSALSAELLELERSKAFASKSFRVATASRPKVASFFAGAGGMDLGLSWAGFDVVYANEVDKSAASTYRNNFSHAIETRSISDVDLNTVPAHDLLVGGFPCQPFSYAGKRMGLSDNRGLLFFALVEDLYIHKPKFFIFENVKGLLNHDGGNTLNNVKKAIADAGYNLTYSVLNAENYLVPQSRERLFLVGVRSDLQSYFEFPVLTLPKVTVRNAIEDLVDNKSAKNHEPMRHSKRILERYRFIPEGGDLRDVPKEHQQRKRGQANLVSGKQSSQSYHRLRSDMPSPTVCAMFQAHFIHYSEHRNLTAREAARLQSFPDDFVFEGNRVSMSWDLELSQYQQIGNAVPPKLAFVLGRALYDQFYESIDTVSSEDPGAHFL